jgi:hypothetical protein
MTAQEIIIYIFAAVAYFVPFYIGWYRKVNGLQLLFWFNLLFAWTFFAWILMIIVAFSLKGEKHHHHNHSLST